MLTLDENEFEKLAEFENDVEMTCQKLLKLCSQKDVKSLLRILGVINFETLDFSPTQSFLWVKIASFLPHTSTLSNLADTILTHCSSSKCFQDSNISKMFPDESFVYTSSKAAGCPVNGTLRLQGGREFEASHRNPIIAKAKCFAQFLLHLEEKYDGDFYVKLLSDTKITLRLINSPEPEEEISHDFSDSPLLSLKEPEQEVELVSHGGPKKPQEKKAEFNNAPPQQRAPHMRYPRVAPHPYGGHHHYQPQPYARPFHPYGHHLVSSY